MFLEAVFGLTNHLTRQIQEKGADISELAARVQAITDSLQQRRSKCEFKRLWKETNSTAVELDLELPTLPHMCKVPRCVDGGSESIEVSDPAEV